MNNKNTSAMTLILASQVGKLTNASMRTPPLTDQQRFDMASDIANAASCMDALKNIHAPAKRAELRAEAAAHVERLHDIAALLAGSRSSEIYALPDDGELTQESAHEG
jgi:hypothetical protein